MLLHLCGKLPVLKAFQLVQWSYHEQLIAFDVCILHPAKTAAMQRLGSHNHRSSLHSLQAAKETMYNTV